MDEAFGILCLSISPELLFYVESCSTPNEVWKILERLFGEQDEIWQSFLFSLGHTKDPQTYAEVDGHPQWEAAMDEELFSPFFNGNLPRSSASASSKLLFENIEVQKSSSIFAADSSPVSKFAEKKTGDPIKVEPEIEFGKLTGLKSVEAMSPAAGLSSLASEPNVAISKPLKIESSSIKEGDGSSLSTPDKQSRKVIHDSVFPVSIQRKSNSSDCGRPATGTERAPPVHAVIQFESRGISHNDLSRPLEKQVSEDVVLPDGTAVKKDLPTGLNPTSNPVTATILDRCLRSVTQADWLMANSFQELERRTVEALRDKLSVYCVGPLLPSAYLDPSDPRDSVVGTSSWVEMDCAQWLDGKPPKSVISVSFGSLIYVPARQIEEIPMGLKESECSFMWVLRHPTQETAEVSAVLPESFLSSKYLTTTGHSLGAALATLCAFDIVLNGINKPNGRATQIPAHQNHQYPQAKQSMARQGRLQAIQAQQGQNKYRSEHDEGPWKMTAFQRLNFTVDAILECLKSSNVIGMGSAGTVYKAEMPNGEVIAVKKLWKNQKETNWCRRGVLAEVDVLGNVRHRNIVRLLGCCSNNKTTLLVGSVLKCAAVLKAESDHRTTPFLL